MIGQLVGAGLQLGGGIAEGIGNYQGMNSLEDEFDRQRNEWAAGNAKQQLTIEQELARRRAALNQDTIAPGMAAQSHALGGASALGRGMGLGGAQIAQTRSGLMPLMPVQARAVGNAERDRKENVAMADMNTKLGQTRMDQEDMAATYPGRMKIAAQKGSLWRQGGVFAQQAGKAIFSMQPPKMNAAKATNDPYGDGTL